MHVPFPFLSALSPCLPVPSLLSLLPSLHIPSPFLSTISPCPPIFLHPHCLLPFLMSLFPPSRGRGRQAGKYGIAGVMEVWLLQVDAFWSCPLPPSHPHTVLFLLLDDLISLSFLSLIDLCFLSVSMFLFLPHQFLLFCFLFIFSHTPPPPSPILIPFVFIHSSLLSLTRFLFHLPHLITLTDFLFSPIHSSLSLTSSAQSLTPLPFLSD